MAHLTTWALIARTDASAIVAEIAQVETEIEKLEKVKQTLLLQLHIEFLLPDASQDLLSAKKIEAVQTQERELLAITLQETLANLHARKVCEVRWCLCDT